ncbi:M1 family metallopeptidase [Actinoplanes sp. TBRC 11911]|uniref:M1 family metallopeptidase n=1 Tax=Actinoplanes sp. TBRC 11911 TaxID=2729386 RepID=UPI0020071DDC|nr:M1 family metallopeptidase [Actinoplanes sp. TBRC 11911]
MSLTYPKKDPKQQVTGNVTITAVATQDLSRFDLDFGGDGLARVTVDNKTAAFRRDGDELIITPARALKKNKAFKVTVSGFAATPVTGTQDDPSGFLTTPDGTVLIGQPNLAHQLFPSNDIPSDKATYTITLTTPTGWTGTANGVRVRTLPHGGYVSSTYRESNPMATELVQVAAGDFVVRTQPSVDGVPIRDVAPARLADTLLPKAKDERAEMAYMVSRVGKYPFENYGSLFIDAPLGVALETQTLPIYDSTIAALPANEFNPSSIHELSHQWFGDSVAPKTWSDVWQNEGHATWYEYNYAADRGTLKEYSGLDTIDDLFKAIYADGDQFRAQFGPVARPLSAATLFDLFNQNVYFGGALTLYALRQQVGAAKFGLIERTWATLDRGTSQGTDDFIALASKVSGQDLTGFLRSWLYGTKTPPMPGHPDWTVKPVTATPAVLSLPRR